MVCWRLLQTGHLTPFFQLQLSNWCGGRHPTYKTSEGYGQGSMPHGNGIPFCWRRPYFQLWLVILMSFEICNGFVQTVILYFSRDFFCLDQWENLTQTTAASREKIEKMCWGLRPFYPESFSNGIHYRPRTCSCSSKLLSWLPFPSEQIFKASNISYEYLGLRLD